MKKTLELLGMPFLIACTVIFYGCNKDQEISILPTTGNANSVTTAFISVTTTTVSMITTSTAATGGNVISRDDTVITACGVCWNTSQSHLPTIEDTKTTDGTTMGYFTSNLMGLDPGTTYFVRAYATNSSGTDYGNLLSFTTAFTQGTGQGQWIQKADFKGGVRYRAAGFSIGSKLYMGLGYDDIDDSQNDFWEWDQATNVWTKKADFPGNSTGADVCFSIGTKGYIGTGNPNSSAILTNEFWEYDPAANTWTQKASLPGTPSRTMSTGFSIGNKGYVGTGFVNNGGSGSNFKDFWEWDQATNVWTKKADFGGMARYGAVGFSIGTKGYIGTGFGGVAGSTVFKDFWEWDQATNVWTKKADFGGAARAFAVGFSIGNKGYIGNGYTGSYPLFKDFWLWDQGTDQWIMMADFGGDARIEAVGVSIGNKGYIGTGIGGPSFLNNFWEFDPNLK